MTRLNVVSAAVLIVLVAGLFWSHTIGAPVKDASGPVRDLNVDFYGEASQSPAKDVAAEETPRLDICFFPDKSDLPDPPRVVKKITKPSAVRPIAKRPLSVRPLAYYTPTVCQRPRWRFFRR